MNVCITYYKVIAPSGQIKVSVLDLSRGVAIDMTGLT